MLIHFFSLIKLNPKAVIIMGVGNITIDLKVWGASLVKLEAMGEKSSHPNIN